MLTLLEPSNFTPGHPNPQLVSHGQALDYVLYFTPNSYVPLLYIYTTSVPSLSVAYLPGSVCSLVPLTD